MKDSELAVQRVNAQVLCLLSGVSRRNLVPYVTCFRQVAS